MRRVWPSSVVPYDSSARIRKISRARVLESLSWQHSVPQLLGAYNRIFRKRAGRV